MFTTHYHIYKQCLQFKVKSIILSRKATFWAVKMSNFKNGNHLDKYIFGRGQQTNIPSKFYSNHISAFI